MYFSLPAVGGAIRRVVMRRAHDAVGEEQWRRMAAALAQEGSFL
jgi:hypothetical protein